MSELPCAADMPVTRKDKRKFKENVLIYDTHETNSSFSNSFLEKDLQLVLTPMHIMLVLFFCAKYNIWNHKITPNSIQYSIFSVLATLTILSSCFYFMIGFSITEHLMGFQYFQHLNKLYVYLLLVFGSFLNSCINIIQKRNNVFLVLKIQNVFRNLKIKRVFKRFICSNWICVIVLNSFHILWVLYSYYNYELNVIGIGISIMSYCFVSFDMTLLYAARIIKLLTEPLNNWVKNVKKSRCVGNFENERYWNKMFEVYMEILEVYEYIEKTIHQMVT